MPIYEYECSRCRVIFEVIQSLGSEERRKCPGCGRRVIRIFSTPNLNVRNYSGPSEAKYARVSLSEEISREKEIQKSYETLHLPRGVKHNPWNH